MKAAVLESYGRIVTRNVKDPSLKDDEVLVKIKYASICGSDQHIYSGEFHPRTKLPFIPGHEFAGVIDQTGKEVDTFAPGEKVTVDPTIPCGECEACRRKHYPACTSLKLLGIDLDGGFAEYISVKPDMLYKLPDEMDDKHAALIELLSIGFHASARSGLAKNDNIVIWGAGKVGHSILHAARTITSGEIIMVDVLDERLELARKAIPGVKLINAKKTDPVDEVMRLTDNRGVDIAFEAVGHHEHLPGKYNPVRSCVRTIRGGGKVCTLGLSGEPVEVLMKELIWKEAEIIASRVSHGEFSESIEALEKGNLNPESMITAVMLLEESDEAFHLLQEQPEKHLKILLKIS